MAYAGFRQRRSWGVIGSHIPDGPEQAKALQASDYIGNKVVNKVVGGRMPLGSEYLTSTCVAAAAEYEGCPLDEGIEG